MIRNSQSFLPQSPKCCGHRRAKSSLFYSSVSISKWKIRLIRSARPMTVLELCFSSGIPAHVPPTPLLPHPEFLISGREEGTLSSQALICLVLPQGRNASEQVKMLQRIEQYNAKQPLSQRVRVSVEIEKPREELFQLFCYGEVVSALQLLLVTSSRLDS